MRHGSSIWVQTATLSMPVGFGRFFSFDGLRRTRYDYCVPGIALVVASIGLEGLLGTEALQSCLPHQIVLRTGPLWAEGQSTLQLHQQLTGSLGVCPRQGLFLCPRIVRWFPVGNSNGAFGLQVCHSLTRVLMWFRTVDGFGRPISDYYSGI